MKALVFASALAAIGLAGTPALASHGCGGWGSGEERCIGNNGLAPNQTRGLDGSDYRMNLSPNLPGKSTVAMTIDIWRSTCGFPGVMISHEELKQPLQHMSRTAYAGHLQCVEFFVHSCKSGNGTAVPCDVYFLTTIERLGG